MDNLNTNEILTQPIDELCFNTKDGTIFSLDNFHNENMELSTKVFKFVELFWGTQEDTDYVLNYIKDNISNEILTHKIAGYINGTHFIIWDIFTFACNSDNYAIIEALLKTDLYDINYFYCFGTNENASVVHMNSHNVDILKLFIDNAAITGKNIPDFNAKDTFGKSAFSESCYHVKACKLMYNTGKCSFDEKIYMGRKDEMTCGEMLLGNLYELQKETCRL